MRARVACIFFSNRAISPRLAAYGPRMMVLLYGYCRGVANVAAE